MGKNYLGVPGKNIRVSPPKRSHVLMIRLMIICGLVCMFFFINWFLNPEFKGYEPLYWLLTFALGFKLLKMIHEWYHYWDVSVPQKPSSSKTFTVDILTTACPGEPKQMIINTLRAMVAVKYPHTNYLCDEGDDPELKKVCEELGVIHVTRKIKVDAKAGNINNALKIAKGELCVVLDPDHVPHEDFLDRVVPYFEDEKIGYVQVVQSYGNQGESLIAKGAAEQTYHFYGPMMMCMNSYGTVQAIGANCTFRREALDSIGGHAAGLSEDMHTAMQIHAKGWKSVYVPETLSKGLVPSTLAGYYSQQLKWSRGTFDLLFYVYPKLFKNFTFRQKLHYFTLPLYFLFGLVNFIDIIVPVVSLFLAVVPWEVDVAKFATMYFPLCGISILIRLYSQRWLLEEHEKGFHIMGGVLRTATWWIFLLGFIYTIFKIKVPYIPTPKNDEPVNNWKLSFPNFVVCLICISSVLYGLSIDWNPYSWVMATYALLNATILGFVVVIGQERLLLDIKQKWKYIFRWENIIQPLYYVVNRTRYSLNSMINNGSLFLCIAAALVFAGYTGISNDDEEMKALEPPEMKNTGGFYTGIYLPAVDATLSYKPVAAKSASFNASFDIVSFYQAWGPESIKKFPEKLMRDVTRNKGIPMITWEPWVSGFAECEAHPELSKGQKVCKNITEGFFNKYLQAYAEKIRAFGDPVFIRFAHEPENPVYPWSPSGGNTSKEYIEAYRYVVTFFENMGVSNVTWVWSPWKDETMFEYFPGGEFVDWVSITCLNYGKASGDGKWYSFEELYKPFQKKLVQLKRPIMLAEFGSTPYGGDQAEWVNDALKKISSDFTEIKSVIFFYSDRDKYWATPWRPHPGAKYINWTFDNEEKLGRMLTETLSSEAFKEKEYFADAYPLNKKTNGSRDKSHFLTGTAGSFQLKVDGKPFYIRGVAYNTAHDWRDGNMPLTRRQLVNDMADIKAMGANAIRRYSPGIYDDNILSVASEFDIKVLYGFWFDPKINYLTDHEKVENYIQLVEEKVSKYKDDPAIFAWSVGNETWGLLKHQYSKPYLTKVRKEYVKMIEHMAQRIHEIDPTRPVITAFEHDEHQLPGEIMAFAQDAPSIDIIGVNSYYEEQISRLQRLAFKMDSLRPYIVSEFGPKGYWNHRYSRISKEKLLMEETDREKANDYAHQWKNYVSDYRGYNLGGFAFCWHDRMEGTNTWFGLTDYKGRLKSSYYALQQAWTGRSFASADLGELKILSPKQKIKAGREITFTAKTPGKKNLTYEWYLFKNDYWKHIEDVEVDPLGTKATIVVPEPNKKYRLYLYASDDKGNVTTTSYPFISN